MARVEHDYYPTPAEAVNVLLRSPWAPPSVCLDPCCGDGAIVRALLASGRWASGFDLHPVGAWPQRDALAAAPWGCSAVVGNPPYRGAASFVSRALREAPAYTAMLLRLSWMEPCADRRALLALHPNVIVLPFRPKFRADRKGSDSVTSAWFVWPGAGLWSVGK